jgi:hypothetical protein
MTAIEQVVLGSMTLGRFILNIFVFGYPILALVLFAASARIIRVGAKKFDREVKDFFTPKTILMLRKLEK